MEFGHGSSKRRLEGLRGSLLLVAREDGALGTTGTRNSKHYVDAIPMR